MADLVQKVILLVEDSRDDELFCKLAISKVVSNPVLVVRDGREAIAYLSGHGIYSDREKFPLPEILLLDLKLPDIDGFGVLEWLRIQANIKPLIVVLSHFGKTKEINLAYKLGAHTFLTKPIKHEDIVHLANHFRDRWDKLHWQSIPNLTSFNEAQN